MRVRYKKNRMVQFYESECLTTIQRELPPALTGPVERCAGCPYPGHGFVCWGVGKDICIRTEVARIMARTNLLVVPGSFRWQVVVMLLSISVKGG